VHGEQINDAGLGPGRAEGAEIAPGIGVPGDQVTDLAGRHLGRQTARMLPPEFGPGGQDTGSDREIGALVSG
jgi:hypothetical protein